MQRWIVVYAALICQAAASPAVFRIQLGEGVSKGPVSGRVIVLIEKGLSKRRLAVGPIPGQTMITAKEVRGLAPGGFVEIDSDTPAFPIPLAELPTGENSAMAIFDPDHSFARDRQDSGDLFSDTVEMRGDGTTLVLNHVTPPKPQPPDTATVKLVDFESPALSKFWGRPIRMRAGVVLPANAAPPLPAVYHVHGFGDNHTEAWREADRYSASAFRAAHIYLDGSWITGHHAFADSVNNGPWATALVTELIPHIEKRFRLAAQPRGRFLMGHSSGGWSAVWLQVNYPDFFGGAWPTSPDALDFRSFSGIDFTPASTENPFRDATGAPRNLIRNVMSFEEYWRFESVLGEYGGQLASFNWTFSPRGEDGRPESAFDPMTGSLNANALRHWERYDVAKILREKWPTLGPKLAGKIRLVVGGDDNFHLEKPAALFCELLASKGMNNACEFVPGRDHFDLFQPYKTYPDGLVKRIDNEMRAKWLAALPR
ncbi:MAG: enterochelin esterase [Acidobacteria bacterium]|nr:enterochelin esterase [Acidobacteriota bacterium]